MKKGFLFTIVTILLLTSLFLLSSSYITRYKKIQENLVQSTVGSKVRYIERDLGSDYLDLINASLEAIERKGNYTELRFNYLSNLVSSTIFNDKLVNYKTFIEKNYSKYFNTNISFFQINETFELVPYNYTFFRNGRTYYILNREDINLLRTVDLKIHVQNPSGIALTLISVPQPTTDPVLLKVNVTDSSGGFDYEEAVFDAGIGIISFSFYDGASLSVSLGTILGRNYSLQIVSIGSDAQIVQLDLNFSSMSNARLTTMGTVDIQPDVGQITKSGKLVLAEEGYITPSKKALLSLADDCLIINVSGACIGGSGDREIRGITITNICSSSITLGTATPRWNTTSTISTITISNQDKWSSTCSWQCTPTGVQNSGVELKFGRRDFLLSGLTTRDVDKLLFSTNMTGITTNLTFRLGPSDSPLGIQKTSSNFIPPHC